MTPTPLGVAVLGASGRMGRAVCALVEDTADVRLTAAWSRTPANMAHATADLAAACAAADVAIDFTLPAALPAVLEACAAGNTPLVSGVTGYDDAGHRLLARAAKKIPVLHEHNLSVGVHVLTALVARASALLPDAFVSELVEMHHAGKRDAPSGTALSLAAAAGEHADMPVHSLRGGNVVGTHTVHFFGPFEHLSLTHRADDRAVFAAGALGAARWLAGQPAGRLWRVADWLGTAP